MTDQTRRHQPPPPVVGELERPERISADRGHSRSCKFRSAWFSPMSVWRKSFDPVHLRLPDVANGRRTGPHCESDETESGSLVWNRAGTLSVSSSWILLPPMPLTANAVSESPAD